MAVLEKYSKIRETQGKQGKQGKNFKKMKLPSKKQIVIGILLSVFTVASIGLGQLFSRDFSGELRESALGQTLFEVFAAISDLYIDEVSKVDVLEHGIIGMIDSLEDPFSHYSGAELTLKEHQDLIGSYGGIGVVLIGRDPNNESVAEIVQVYEGSPAHRAGLLRGDIIYQVDGEDVLNWDADSIAIKLRGDVDTPISLAVRRHGEAQLLIISLVRKPIQVQSVETMMIDASTGYIRIYNFYNYNVYEQFKEALDEVVAQQAKTLIIDVRDNGGGLINQGVLIANELLKQKDIAFQKTRGIVQRIARADNTAINIPIVILVNRNSASTAELLAASLKENNRVIVVGETTFGKGVGQTVLPLTNGGQITQVSFEWLTPKQQNIQSIGVAPDIFIQDSNIPHILKIEGRAAEPDTVIDIYASGRYVGRTVVQEDGSYRFIEIAYSKKQPESQESLIDLKGDMILNVALEIAASDIMHATGQ